MRTLQIWTVVGCLAIGACTDVDRKATSDAAIFDPFIATADASAAPSTPGSDASAMDAGTNIQVPPPTGTVRFEAIPLDPNGCSVTRPGLSIQSPDRLLITTGCGFYSVDPTRHIVTQLRPQGMALDDDGDTIAVLAGQLGLSTDGGKTFVWTDWQLGHCEPQEVRIRAGDGLVVATCAAGVGRWRGTGAAFEMPDAGAPLLLSPYSAAHGAHIVIYDVVTGWIYSNNGGDSFARMTTVGLPSLTFGHELEMVGSRLFVSVRDNGSPDAGSALFAAPLDGGTFERVAAFATRQSPFRLGYHAGALMVLNPSSLALSTDDGNTFIELQTEGRPTGEAIAKYAGGRIYIVAKGTLYVSVLDR